MDTHLCVWDACHTNDISNCEFHFWRNLDACSIRLTNWVAFGPVHNPRIAARAFCIAMFSSLHQAWSEVPF